LGGKFGEVPGGGNNLGALYIAVPRWLLVLGESKKGAESSSGRKVKGGRFYPEKPGSEKEKEKELHFDYRYLFSCGLKKKRGKSLSRRRG